MLHENPLQEALDAAHDLDDDITGDLSTVHRADYAALHDDLRWWFRHISFKGHDFGMSDIIMLKDILKKHKEYIPVDPSLDIALDIVSKILSDKWSLEWTHNRPPEPPNLVEPWEAPDDPVKSLRIAALRYPVVYSWDIAGCDLARRIAEYTDTSTPDMETLELWDNEACRMYSPPLQLVIEAAMLPLMPPIEDHFEYWDESDIA